MAVTVTPSPYIETATINVQLLQVSFHVDTSHSAALSGASKEPCVSVRVEGHDPVAVAQAARKALETWEGK